MTALEEVELWFKDQKENHGLVYFSVFAGDKPGLTSEELARAFLDTLNSPSVEITDLNF